MVETPRVVASAGGAGPAARRTAAVALAAGLLAGCAHFPLNRPLASFDPRAGYRLETVPAAARDELAVVLAVSGGGSRAAAFAYGVLEEMRRTAVGAEGARQRPALLDELDVISSVSGGSIVAAYYALYGDRLFEDFSARYLERDVQRLLVRRLFAPGNRVRLASPNFDRVDLLAEYLGRELFDGATFADLEGRRPFLLINATDMTRGVSFAFTQESFDPLCADLASYPLGRAVAASASVPLVLTEVTLQNYGWEACGFPGAAAGGTWAASLRDPDKRPWVHLQDGGLADNLGLSSLEEIVLRSDGGCDDPRLDPLGRRVVVIVIDAVGDLDRSPESRKQGLSLAKTVLAAVNIPIDENSDRGIELLPSRLDRWLDRANRCAGVDEPAAARRERVYPIVLDFPSVARFDPRASARLRRIRARLRLEADELELLRSTGAEALRRAPELRRLLRDLAGPAARQPAGPA